MQSKSQDLIAVENLRENVRDLLEGIMVLLKWLKQQNAKLDLIMANATVGELSSDQSEELKAMKGDIAEIATRLKPTALGICPVCDTVVWSYEIHARKDKEAWKHPACLTFEDKIAGYEKTQEDLLDKIGAQNELLLKLEDADTSEGSKYDVLEEYIRRRLREARKSRGCSK